MDKKKIKQILQELCEYQKEGYEKTLLTLKEGTFEEFEDAIWVLVENQKDINFYTHLLEEEE